MSKKTFSPSEAVFPGGAARNFLPAAHHFAGDPHPNIVGPF
jgi:hypothetical protein